MIQKHKKNDIYQELLNLPENVIGEILNGDVYTQPRPAPKTVRNDRIIKMPIYAKYSVQ